MKGLLYLQFLDCPITTAALLLQDEPENDLDVETLRALENAISEFAGNVGVCCTRSNCIDTQCNREHAMMKARVACRVSGDDFS